MTLVMDTDRTDQPLFLLVAPSGTGKTTLLHRAVAARPALFRITTATTREPRRDKATGEPLERSGEHYHFMSETEFLALRDAGGFVETSFHFGAHYGCPRSELARLRTRPGIIIVDINGAASLQEVPNVRTVPIFVRTATKAALYARLESSADQRGTDERIARADLEWSTGLTYPDQVVNEDLEQATADLLAIIDRELAKSPPAA